MTIVRYGIRYWSLLFKFIAILVVNTSTALSAEASAVNILITEPTNGASLTFSRLMGDLVLVRGTVDAGGSEVAVTVNGFVAYVNAGQWASKIPLGLGENVISATATSITGSSATTRISVTGFEGASVPLVLRASTHGGVTPVEVTWKVENRRGRPLVRFQFDETGAGRFGDPVATFDGVKTTYTLPGLKFPTLQATDDEGRTYVATTVVNVMDRAALDALLRSRWAALKTALITGDAAGALTHIVTHRRSAYAAQFSALGAQLAVLGRDMPSIEPVYFEGDFAKYRLRQQQNVGGTMVTITYYIYFSVDADGIWRIESF